MLLSGCELREGNGGVVGVERWAGLRGCDGLGYVGVVCWVWILEGEDILGGEDLLKWVEGRGGWVDAKWQSC
jgi:hypothetical protein